MASTTSRSTTGGGPLKLHFAVGDDDHTATVLGNLGDCHLFVGSPQAAVDCYRRALEMWQERGVQSGIARTMTGIGEALRAQGKYDEAIGTLEETLTVLDRLGDRATAADVLETLGRAHFEGGGSIAARKCWDEGLEVDRTHRLEARAEAILLDLALLAPPVDAPHG